MKVLLLQLDGKIPNIALMRIAYHHRNLGDDIELRRISNPTSLEVGFWDHFDAVYASAIFSRTLPLAHRLKEIYPDAIIGGTGWSKNNKLEDIGLTSLDQDYGVYPGYPHSIGFTQRGCRLSCSFCVVPTKEGKVRAERTIAEIWRGDPHPKHLLLLDNDFFGQPDWRDLIAAMRDGGFKVCFTQGINARLIGDEEAAALASIRYYDADFTTRRLYAAWDNRKDEERLFAGLNALVRYGVKPDHIMVYMLLGYWPGETAEDRDYRRAKLRDFGCRPYPMPFTRTPELVGFQRWVIGAYDKRIPWADWQAANYRPERLAA